MNFIEHPQKNRSITFFPNLYIMQESHVILQHIYVYSIYSRINLIFIADCSMKRSEQFNAKFIHSFKKPKQSILSNKISLFLSTFILRLGEPNHLNINAYVLYLHLLYLKLFFYMTSQELHYLLN